MICSLVLERRRGDGLLVTGTSSVQIRPAPLVAAAMVRFLPAVARRETIDKSAAMGSVEVAPDD